MTKYNESVVQLLEDVKMLLRSHDLVQNHTIDDYEFGTTEYNVRSLLVESINLISDVIHVVVYIYDDKDFERLVKVLSVVYQKFDSVDSPLIYSYRNQVYNLYYLLTNFQG